MQKMCFILFDITIILLIFIKDGRRFLVSVRKGEKVVVDVRSNQVGLTLF